MKYSQVRATAPHVYFVLGNYTKWIHVPFNVEVNYIYLHSLKCLPLQHLVSANKVAGGIVGMRDL